MSPRTRSFLLGALLTASPFYASAESEPPHPVVDIPRTNTPSAKSLQNLGTSELQARRETYTEQLDAVSATPTVELEQQLLRALLVYDDERIRIIDLIPGLIEKYEVDEQLEKDMLNFRAALAKIVDELRPEVTTLQSYKPYDFRLGISYAAMMTILQKQETIRNRMLQDQKDPETMLGQHSQRIQHTYRAVKKAREQLELGYQTEALKEQIDQIDAELQRRQS